MMSINKKVLCLLLVIVAMTGLAIAGCGGGGDKKAADNWPAQNLNGVIAWGAGGATDNVARTLTPAVEKALGKTIVLANKPGATGAIATQFVFDQKADGYTVFYHAENPQLYKILNLSKLDYDDFDPIIVLGKGVSIICVPKDSPINSYDDLIAAIKAAGGKFNMGSSGVGGLPYTTTALIKQQEKIEVNFVTYDGEGPLITALLGKQIEASAIGIGAAAQYVKTGDLKGIAVVTNKKLDILPNVPALGELKPQYKEKLESFGPFYAVLVKKGTPEVAVKKLTDAYVAGFKDAKFQDYMAKNGVTPMGMTGAEARKFLNDWRSQMAWLIYDAGGAKESPEKFNIPKFTK